MIETSVFLEACERNHLGGIVIRSANEVMKVANCFATSVSKSVLFAVLWKGLMKVKYISGHPVLAVKGFRRAPRAEFLCAVTIISPRKTSIRVLTFPLKKTFRPRGLFGVQEVRGCPEIC